MPEPPPAPLALDLSHPLSGAETAWEILWRLENSPGLLRQVEHTRTGMVALVAALSHTEELHSVLVRRLPPTTAAGE